MPFWHKQHVSETYNIVKFSYNMLYIDYVQLNMPSATDMLFNDYVRLCQRQQLLICLMLLLFNMLNRQAMRLFLVTGELGFR